MTSFLNENEDIFGYKAKEDAERRFKKEINSEHRTIKASVLTKIHRADIRNFIYERQKELLKEYENKGVERIDTFVGVKTLRGEQERREPKERKEAPFDFGIEKIKAIDRYADFVEQNIPDSNLQRFTDTFPTETENNNGKIKLDSDKSYIGFTFEYNGKQCTVAESFGDPAAMYLHCGELGSSDFKKMFDLSKSDADKEPDVAVVDHLDKEHFDEDLDTSYQKAFMFFKSGDKEDVLYRSQVKQEKWRENQKLEFPAWPISIDNSENVSQEDLNSYQEWQRRQDRIQQRLKDAIERGGPEEVERERERIAREEYDRMMNTQLEDAG